jgi:[ribosomal protein S18]-alanine N-acetyltransferase
VLKPPWPYQLRPLRLSDIEAVQTIERAAFPTPWKASAYTYELTQNQLATYHALTARTGDQPAQLIGYSGYWMMAGEAHISTIAVQTEWRGRGLGELLLLNMLFLAAHNEADLATLEVRPSNTVAQALYRKYRLNPVGERPRYYRDNGESALLMTVEPLDKAYRAFLREMREELYARLSQP